MGVRTAFSNPAEDQRGLRSPTMLPNCTLM